MEKYNVRIYVNTQQQKTNQTFRYYLFSAHFYFMPILKSQQFSSKNNIQSYVIRRSLLFTLISDSLNTQWAMSEKNGNLFFGSKLHQYVIHMR